MIDLHTHILPGIDDGARDREESLLLIDNLYDQGIDAVVCTPHYYPFETALDDFVYKREKAMGYMGKVKTKLIPASETYLHEYLFNYNSLTPLTVGNTKYLLLELPFNKKWDDGIYEAIEKLIIYFNIIPIIAHIERYPAAKKRNIKRLKGLGCIMQLNTSSLLDKKLRRRTLSLIKSGMIDVLGSDCHNMDKRPPKYSEAVEYIRKKLGSQYMDKFIKHAEMIIEGLDIR